MSSNVDTQHAIYKRMAKPVKLMRSVIEGQEAVKLLGKDALPGFIPEDITRYELYLQRAIFTNYTGRTSQGLAGAMQRKDPVIELPTTLDYFLDNTDGSGTGLIEFQEQVAKEILDVGECGLLTVRPSAPEGSTAEDETAMGLRSKLSLYPRESIINWKYKTVNHVSILSLVVLVESEDIEKTDEFKSDPKPLYRVLALDDAGNYYQRVFDHNKEQVGSDVYIKDSAGSPLKYIPFEPVGSSKNMIGVNKPPLIDMANVNIGHYRNSADYEEGVHIHGQGTFVVSVGDTTVDQFTKANPNGVVVGARRGLVLGNGGSAEIVQMEANGAANEAGVRKEEQMLAIGAKIVQSSTRDQTAEEAKINAGAESASLNTMADNIANAFIKSLEHAADFEGVAGQDITFIPNKEFFPETIDPQMVAQYIMLETNGTISKADTRAKLRKTEILAADRTDDDIEADLEAEGFILNNDGGTI